jgi:hypothetical protein
VAMTTQDRPVRGPVAALLILLSLVLGSGAAAATAELNGSATRLAPERHSSAAALLPAGARDDLEDEADRWGDGPSALPGRARIVTERLGARPRAGFPAAVGAAAPRPPSASYRARAPPAA